MIWTKQAVNAFCQFLAQEGYKVLNVFEFPSGQFSFDTQAVNNPAKSPKELMKEFEEKWNKVN